jgi:hypothetical protein
MTPLELYHQTLVQLQEHVSLSGTTCTEVI